MTTQRPGGRTARNREAILTAATRLLQKHGPAAISMADIAEAAGVAATSLYRRWGSLDALLFDVAMDKLRTEKPLPDTGSLEGDLRSWGRAIVSTLLNPDRSSIFMVLVASVARMESHSEHRAQAIEPRVVQVREMLQRAQDRGEATPSAAEIRDYFMAPLYMRAIFGGTLDAACVESLVEHVLSLGQHVSRKSAGETPVKKVRRKRAAR